MFVEQLHTKTVPFEWDNGVIYYDCRASEMEELPSKIYNISVFILTFALPLLIQTFSYGSIGRKLMRDKCINNKLPLRRNSGQDRNKVKVRNHSSIYGFMAFRLRLSIRLRTRFQYSYLFLKCFAANICSKCLSISILCSQQ